MGTTVIPRFRAEGAHVGGSQDTKLLRARAGAQTQVFRPVPETPCLSPPVSEQGLCIVGSPEEARKENSSG